MGINPWLLGLQIVHFLLVYLLLRSLVFPRISGILESRRERIATSLAEADRVREAAAAERASFEAQLAEERRTSQQRLRDAVARSEEAARKRLDEANAEAEQIVARARAEADQLRAQALAGMHSEIADLALGAASKALGQGIDPNQHRALIHRFLDEELGALA